MEIKKIHEFMELVGRLKHMKRTGWVIKNIPNPETIAGHMYRMAMLSLLTDNNENLDTNKILRMTLIHDLAECIVGDITPHCGVSPEEKHRQEDEYERQESPEAQYVKDLDRLDLIMQAYEYEKRDNIPGELEEFFVSSVNKIKHPFVDKIVKEIVVERNSLLSDSSKIE
ncbi:hypothetical protein M0802_011059 [Mischocyttarus mexicanus]|nr:hypothetical protein M0802_011059 [Mischocyttarus mexicanus]